MQVISLQSGSNGNCIYVESKGVRLLFDAGISGKQAQQRLAARDRDISGIDALLISHDHSDHARCAGIYHRKFGLPVHVTAPTFRTADSKYPLGRFGAVQHFEAGSSLEFGPVTVETHSTPHDSSDGVAFVVDDGSARLGILTDLGHVFDGLEEIIRSLDAIILESNYDPDMLDNGPYPAHLKARIQGAGGHLSNTEAAELLLHSRGKQMKWACLAHLSEENNRPALALRTHRRIIGNGLELTVASRYAPTDVLAV